MENVILINEGINLKQMRDNLSDRIEVLDKVKEIVTFGGGDFVSVELASEYYEVNKDTIKKCINRNKEELEIDGLKVYKKDEILKGHDVTLENIIIPNRGMILIPKRAMLRIGMLLRDSDIAKELRTQLLNVVENVESENPSILTKEMDSEKDIVIKLTEAMMKGDMITFMKINTEYNEYKNRHISKLENTIEIITTRSLNITDSRNVINRLMRLIATKKFNSRFGDAYNELYSKVNYQLGINIKGRKKEKNQKLIDLFKEEELFRVEEIVRVFANDCGIDVEKELKIGA